VNRGRQIPPDILVETRFKEHLMKKETHEIAAKTKDNEIVIEQDDRIGGHSQIVVITEQVPLLASWLQEGMAKLTTNTSPQRSNA